LELPKTYGLNQNHPNPFNANTEIRYRTPEDGPVTLKIFNTMGQEVRVLVDATQKASEHIVTWDGQDDFGGEVASGLYFCRLDARDFSKTIKMVLVR
jgi:flagellar hook assembly protein FlgD